MNRGGGAVFYAHLLQICAPGGGFKFLAVIRYEDFRCAVTWHDLGRPCLPNAGVGFVLKRKRFCPPSAMFINVNTYLFPLWEGTNGPIKSALTICIGYAANGISTIGTWSVQCWRTWRTGHSFFINFVLNPGEVLLFAHNLLTLPVKPCHPEEWPHTL